MALQLARSQQLKKPQPKPPTPQQLLKVRWLKAKPLLTLLLLLLTRLLLLLQTLLLLLLLTPLLHLLQTLLLHQLKLPSKLNS